MQDDLVGHINVVEAGGFACHIVCSRLLITLIETMVVVSVYHDLCVLLDVIQALLVKCLFHFFSV